MRIDVLGRRWGSPAGAPDGMAMAVSFLAWTLCEMGHDVRGYLGEPGEPWQHPRVRWVLRRPLDTPEDWVADLIITTVPGSWHRTTAAAEAAGARGRCVYWHHFGGLPPGDGCLLAAPPAIATEPGWMRRAVLPPSSWTAEAGGAVTGAEVLIPGAGRAKGGQLALAVARLCPDLRFYVLPGRSGYTDVQPWRQLPNAEVARDRVAPESFLARAAAVLSPTYAEVHPLTLVEAAVRGIPIVCTDLPSTRAAAGPGAAYLPLSAPAEAWAAALRAGIASPPPPLVLRPYAAVVADAIAVLRSA